MMNAIRCAGHVLSGIAIALAGTASLLAMIGGLMWVSSYSARTFGLDDTFAPLFFVGYLATVAGAAGGAAYCRENIRHR